MIELRDDISSQSLPFGSISYWRTGPLGGLSAGTLRTASIALLAVRGIADHHYHFNLPDGRAALDQSLAFMSHLFDLGADHMAMEIKATLSATSAGELVGLSIAPSIDWMNDTARPDCFGGAEETKESEI